VVAVTRLGVGALPPLPPLAVLLAGGTLSAAGTLLLASADTLVTGLLGMAGAAAGTAVLFPTLLTAGVADVDPAVRGRATSAITATAYLGFLLGPVLVGWLAQSQDLRAAMVGVAGLAVVLTLASWPVLRAAAAVSRSDAGQSDAGRSDVARCAPPARPHR
jgi:MFS family permease